ncbi:uncharacterized protein LOC131321298 [Rhododendron vialii]|uniref:uncharacterized protein LOC131321298 n=1 Tax=Rhododendron vialii TaxID=182163 RepID=UPI00265F015E|nr:uncharacterized protein LOC131321298 [Rhododendron vialii]
MAKKRKATYVGSGKENSKPQVGKDISKLASAQRARRERERNLKQSTTQRSEQHLLWDTRTQPLHEINIGATRDEHCANIGNNLHIREDTQRANTIAQARQKSSYADKGKGLLTYAIEKDSLVLFLHNALCLSKKSVVWIIWSLNKFEIMCHNYCYEAGVGVADGRNCMRELRRLEDEDGSLTGVVSGFVIAIVYDLLNVQSHYV